jgi:1,4-alpha-glucan branching enzyme
MSSWGAAGYGKVWLNSSNDWIYRHLHKCADLMVAAASRFSKRATPLEERALNQMARELLLAQSSDWAFIMTSGTMVEYAERRTKDHVNRFLKLHDDLMTSVVEESFLSTIEYRDNIFPDIDFRIYASDTGLPTRLSKDEQPKV